MAMQDGLFHDIIKEAQKISMGSEWQEVDKQMATYFNTDAKHIKALLSPYLTDIAEDE